MKPSSTSSSERRLGPTLALGGFRPWAFVFVVVVLIGVELVARRPWAWTLVPNSPTGVLAVQDRVVSLLDVSPEIVVLGNSRMIDAVLPRRLERTLGLAEGAAVNLSIPSARPFDYLTLYNRHHERLSSAGLWILGVDDNTFGLEMDSAELRFRFLASLEQRWDYGGPKRMSYTAGWFLRSLDYGSAARMQLHSALAGRGDVELASDLRIVWTEQRETGPPRIPKADMDRIIERNYAGYHSSRAQEGYLETLVALCRDSGANVLIVRPPVRDAYLDRAEELDPEGLAAAGTVYSRLSGEQLLFGRASEAGMSPEDFLDYGHVSRRGGRRFTDRLGAEIRSRFPRWSPQAR